VSFDKGTITLGAARPDGAFRPRTKVAVSSPFVDDPARLSSSTVPKLPGTMSSCRHTMGAHAAHPQEQICPGSFLPVSMPKLLVSSSKLAVSSRKLTVSMPKLAVSSRKLAVSSPLLPCTLSNDEGTVTKLLGTTAKCALPRRPHEGCSGFHGEWNCAILPHMEER
jgi:hypothetical protein